MMMKVRFECANVRFEFANARFEQNVPMREFMATELFKNLVIWCLHVSMSSNTQTCIFIIYSFILYKYEIIGSNHRSILTSNDLVVWLMLDQYDSF